MKPRKRESVRPLEGSEQQPDERKKDVYVRRLSLLGSIAAGLLLVFFLLSNQVHQFLRKELMFQHQNRDETSGSNSNLRVVVPTNITAPPRIVMTEKPEEIRNEVSSIDEINSLINELRALKEKGTVMETDEVASVKIRQLQDKLRPYLIETYGPEPYLVEMKLTFPESMLDSGSKFDTIVVELAPVALVPYNVYYFLETISKFKNGAFHRNAGHVLQALVRPSRKGLAFQEYHPDYPHKQYTLGYAGRPGGPEFYISTVDNTANHGPGSQGSKTEADGIIGKVYDSRSINVVKRMTKQPGKGPSGFISDTQNFISITELNLIQRPS